MAKLRFTKPESRPSFTIAQIESPISLDHEARRVSGHVRRGVVDGDWRKSEPFDLALADLDLAAQTGGPVQKLLKAILAKLVADGVLPAGTVEAD